MHLVSVNVGGRASVVLGDRVVETGIGKRPVDRAGITASGVVDDAVVDTRHHGGPDQAVYVYAAEDYRWWAAELGRDDLHPGLFGENLTVELDGHGALRVGDRLHVGPSVVVEVTAPRIPCAVFANAVSEPGWVARFNAARRHGAYARVLAPGGVSAGDPVVLGAAPADNPDVEELADLHLARRPDPGRLRWVLANAPIAGRTRADFERNLSRLDASS